MPEQLPKREKESIAEDVKFVSDSMEEVSEALSRYAIVPTPTNLIDTQGLAAATDEEIAKLLSEVEVIDSHFDNLNFDKDEGVKDAAILTAAKAEGTANQIQDSEVKNRFEQFKDRVLAGTGNALASVGGKKAMTGATSGILALVMTACGGGEVVAGSTQVPETDATQPRTEEVTQVPTETPTEVPATPTEAPTETPEATATPEVAERQIAILPEYSVEIPAEMLEPLEEDEITRLIWEETGEELPFGLIDQWTSPEDREWFRYIHVSGIFRGILAEEGHPRGNELAVIEVPLESGDSQYLLLRVFNDDVAQFNQIFMVSEDYTIPADTEELDGFRRLRRNQMIFSDLVQFLHENEDELVGLQTITGVAIWRGTDGVAAQQMNAEQGNENMKEFFANIREGRLTHRIELDRVDAEERFQHNIMIIPENLFE